MSNLGTPWVQYQSLMRDRPEAFSDTGSLHIVTDPEIVRTFQQKSGRTIGVVYSSPYHLMVVDLVYIQQGEYFAYERILPTDPKGAVVVIPQYRGDFLLLKQYRHALRDYQYAFPRGFGEKGIAAEDNVRKEMEEELSAQVTDVAFLGICVADSGLCGDKVSIFSCVVDHFSVNQGHEGISDITVLSDDEMKQWIKSGKLNDGFTLSAYSLLNAYNDSKN
jgi:ADP-ribose pyrophosphatase